MNGHWTMPPNLHHEHVDHLLVAMRRHMEAFGEVDSPSLLCSTNRACVCLVQVPGLWKADIDGAFRRIPVRPEHRWATTVVYMYRGVPMTSTHNGMPFGASASVVAWHRVGEVLAHIARRCAYSAVFEACRLSAFGSQAADVTSFPICR